MFLIELGSDVSAPGGSAGTALAIAALQGQCGAITLLLDSGRYGKQEPAAEKLNQFLYALISATFLEYTNIILLLIEFGADVNVKNPYRSRNFTALHAAAGTGNDKHIALLIEHGADVNACGGRSGTTLTTTYTGAWYLIVEQLLDHGALPDLRGRYYGTAVCAGIQESTDNPFIICFTARL